MSLPKDKNKIAAYLEKLRTSHLGQVAWNKGKQLSAEYRKKLSEAKKGKIYPNSFKKGHGGMRDAASYRDVETRKKISLGRMGKTHTAEVRALIGLKGIGRKAWNHGKKFPFRPRPYLKGKNAGAKNHNWKGGITPINFQIRNSAAMKAWRMLVFLRDDFTCQACGIRGVKLHADHELPFAFYPQLRFEVLNGRSLCVPCHKKTPTYKNKNNIYG